MPWIFLCDVYYQSNQQMGDSIEVTSSIDRVGMDLNDLYVSAPTVSACSSLIRAALTYL